MENKNLFATISSDIGCVREKNQDNFYFDGKILNNYNQKHTFERATCKDGIFAIADGMGGESLGEFASLCVVDLLRQKINSGDINNSEDINNFVLKANEKICIKMQECRKKIGTTVALAHFKDNYVSFYNLGDSKCLLYRDGKVEQFSKDHTVVANLVRMNILTEEQAKTDKRRHQLSQHIGIFPEEFTISLYESQKIETKPNDIIILCSDGLTDALDFESIANLIENTEYIDEISEKLVNEAIRKGSKDNVTVLVAYNGFRGIENANFKGNKSFVDISEVDPQYLATLKSSEDTKITQNHTKNAMYPPLSKEPNNPKIQKEAPATKRKHLLLWTIIYILSSVIGIVSGIFVSGFITR